MTKEIPQQPELELAVLGAMLLDPVSVLNVSDLFPVPEVFYREENQAVYKSIVALNQAGSVVDILTVAEYLKKSGDYKRIGGAKFLASVASKISSSAHVEIHARILLEAWMKRCIISGATKLLAGSYDDSADVFGLLDDAEKLIMGQTGQLFRSSESTFEKIAEEETERMELAEAGDIAGVSTGLHDLDIRISGLCQPDLLVIAARPGAGKSALAFSIMCTMAAAGNPVGLITLEMGEGQVFNRMMSISGAIYGSKIRNRQMNSMDKSQYKKWSEMMKKWPVYISETSNTLSKLRVKATIWKNKYGIKALFVDYLQLMSGEGKKGQNRENEISDISRGLKQLAKSLEIPIIALSQLSREVEKRTSKMPQLSDLRESGSIEQDADFVLFLMRPEYYKFDGVFNVGGHEISSEGLCIADLAKNRHGATGEFPLRFHGPTAKFMNHEATVATVGVMDSKDRIAAFDVF